jgi:hypothetical protein
LYGVQRSLSSPRFSSVVVIAFASGYSRARNPPQIPSTRGSSAHRNAVDRNLATDCFASPLIRRDLTETAFPAESDA